MKVLETLVSVVLVWLSGAVGCTQEESVTINSINFNPVGGVGVTEITASINTSGEGNIRVEWLNNYGTVALEKTENITVHDGGTYTSNLNAPQGDTLTGYYWIDIYDHLLDTLLAHSDSFFYGDGPTEAPSGLDFRAERTSGIAPFNVYFESYLDSWENIVPFTLLWDFGDGEFNSISGNPNHIYNNPGSYTVMFTVSNLWGADTVIKANYITVTEP